MTTQQERKNKKERNMNARSRTEPVQGVSPFEEPDNKTQGDDDGHSEGPDARPAEGAEGFDHTNYDQGLVPQVPSDASYLGHSEGPEVHPAEGAEKFDQTNYDQGLVSQVPSDASYLDLDLLSLADMDIDLIPPPSFSSSSDDTDPPLSCPFDESISVAAICESDSSGESHFPDCSRFVFCLLLAYVCFVATQVVVSPPDNIRTSNRSFQFHEYTVNENDAYSSNFSAVPRTEQDNDLRRGVDIQTANDTIQTQGSQEQPCSNDTEQPVMPNNNLHPINGTASESYMEMMLRQETRDRQDNHYDNVFHIRRQPVETTSINREYPNNEEERTDNVVEILNNSGTRPPETLPQGVPHGGSIQILGQLYRLSNTCNLDQILNGLLLICRFQPLFQLLEELARRFPEGYQRLWEAVCLCREGRYAEAKAHLVPRVFDMLSSEGERVMPLLQRQLCHRFRTCCENCGWTTTGDRVDNIPLGELDPTRGFQEAFDSYFTRHGVCSQEGCGGRTTSTAVFDVGTPPLIIAVNLFFLCHCIPNFASVNNGEIVQLFGERYMMFLFSVCQPGIPTLGIPGHYMSLVFRPDGEPEAPRRLEGAADTYRRPTGSWVFYSNNMNGDLETDRRDPDGTIPSYVYFIRLPAASDAVVNTVQGEEEEESRDSEDNGQ